MLVVPKENEEWSTTLRRAGEDGQKRLLKVATERNMLHDVEWTDATKILLSILEHNSEDVGLQYHADCYSAITHAKSLRSNKNLYNEPSNRTPNTITSK